jgi:hypothetical protein
MGGVPFALLRQLREPLDATTMSEMRARRKSQGSQEAEVSDLM